MNRQEETVTLNHKRRIPVSMSSIALQKSCAAIKRKYQKTKRIVRMVTTYNLKELMN